MGLIQWLLLLLIPTMGYTFLNPFSAFRLGRQNCGYVMPLCSSQTQRPYPYYTSSLENIENYGYYGFGYQPHSKPWAFVNHIGYNRGSSEPSTYSSSNSAYSYNPSYTGSYGSYNYNSNPHTAYGYSRNWQASNIKPVLSTVERQKTSYNKPSSYKA